MLEKIYFELLKLKMVIFDNIENPKLHLILLENINDGLDKIIKKIEGE